MFFFSKVSDEIVLDKSSFGGTEEEVTQPYVSRSSGFLRGTTQAALCSGSSPPTEVISLLSHC